MNRNLFATIFGVLAGAAQGVQTAGFHVGHLGSGDWLDLAKMIGVMGLGVVTHYGETK